MARSKTLTHEMTVRFTDDEFDMLEYWAEKQDSSKREFIRDALDYYIKYLNSDYDLPTAEVARLNQLVDDMNAMKASMDSLSHICLDGFGMISDLARGGDYLSYDERKGE